MATKLGIVARETALIVSDRPVVVSLEQTPDAPLIGVGNDAIIRLRLKGKKSDIPIRLSVLVLALMGRDAAKPKLATLPKTQAQELGALLDSLERDPVIQAALAVGALAA